MHAWEQIQITVDYIEEHISENIEIEELAKLSSLSVFYFQRLFKRLVKKTVMEYIKLRRLALSLNELTKTKKKIIDIAIELGFNSHEQFTRAFKECFGITPDGYRSNPIALNYLTKPELLLMYVMVDENVPIITDGIVLEINRKKLDKSDYFTGYNVELPVEFLSGLGVESGEDPLYNLWDKLHANKMSFSELVQNGDEIGVAYGSEKEGYFRYFAGAQVNQLMEDKDKINWTMSEGEYIVCSFEAESFQDLVMDVLYKATQYLYNVWLKNKNIQTEFYSIERYKNHNNDTTYMEIWVKINKR